MQADPLQPGNDAENAIERTYNPATKTWKERQTQIYLAPSHFDKGAMRACYKMRFGSQDPVRAGKTYVAKLIVDPRKRKNVESYERDVIMQSVSRAFAHDYNKVNPPKKVDFLEAFILVLTERDNQVVAVEQFVSGEYIKYNNNWNWAEDKRNTPQAFSHWSYEFSRRKLLICDIQGVGDLWTDPQIHTSPFDKNYGMGNMGDQGIHQFLQAHECNAICRWLKLPNPNARIKPDFAGTVATGTLPPNIRPNPQQQPEAVGFVAPSGPSDAQAITDGIVAIKIDDTSNSPASPSISSTSPGAQAQEKPVWNWGPADANRIRIVIIEARNLKSKCLHKRGSNPFAEVSLGKNRRQTTTVPSTCEPKWNDIMEVSYTPDFAQHFNLSIQVFHKDHGRDPRNLGVLSINLADYTRPMEDRKLQDCSTKSDARWWTLQPLPTSKDKGSRGEIFLSICRYPASERANLPPVIEASLPDIPASMVGPASTHEFKLKYLKRPTWCDVCRDFFWGVLSPQAYKCQSCKMVVHNDCLHQITKNCKPKKK